MTASRHGAHAGRLRLACLHDREEVSLVAMAWKGGRHRLLSKPVSRSQLVGRWSWLSWMQG